MRRAFPVCFLTIVCLIVLCSCGRTSGSGEVTVSDCLGGYSYDSPVIAMVYEQVPGEEEGMYGILYREVTDLGGLTTQHEIPMCLYFYSSFQNDVHGITAGVEDLAQYLEGRVLFVAVDIMEKKDISSAYGIEAVPEFVLIRDGARVATFDGMSYEYWSIQDVQAWLADNGIS